MKSFLKKGPKVRRAQTSPGLTDSVISEVNEVMLSVRPIDAEGSWIPTDPECGEEGGHLAEYYPLKATLLNRQT